MTGETFPVEEDDNNGLRAEDWQLLREVCGDDPVFFGLQVVLLGVERQYRGMTRRTGVFDALVDRLRVGLYGTEEEAVAVLKERDRRKKSFSLEVIEGLSPGEDSSPQPRKDEDE